jgi:tetratricopeptide (TPR) repeat protein
MQPIQAVFVEAREAASAGRWSDAQRLFRSAAVETSPVPRERARATDARRWSSIAGMRLGDWENAVDDADRSRAMAAALADVRREAKSLNVAGAVEFERGNWRAALDLFDRARVVARPLKDRVLLARIDNNEGVLWAAHGIGARARRLYATALAGFRAARRPLAAARVMNNLGLLLADEGAARQALDWYEEAARAARDAGDSDLLVTVLTNLARAAAESGRASRARAAVDEARALTEGMDERSTHVDLCCALAVVFREEHALVEAESWVAAALEAAASRGGRLAEADAWEQCAWLRMRQGRGPEAREALGQASERYEALGAKAALVRLSGLRTTIDLLAWTPCA